MAAPAAPAASLSLKDQGNDGFRASSWDLSVTFYTQAPSDPTSFTPDDAAALFSNRAAAYIHLFQFDRVGVSLRSFRQVDTRTCTSLFVCLFCSAGYDRSPCPAPELVYRACSPLFAPPGLSCSTRVLWAVPMTDLSIVLLTLDIHQTSSPSRTWTRPRRSCPTHPPQIGRAHV